MALRAFRLKLTMPFRGTRRIVGIDWSVPMWVFREFCTSLGLMRAARIQMALRAFRLKLTMSFRGTLSA